MKINDDEFLEVVEELSLAIGRLLALHRDQVNEIFPDPTDAAKDRLAKLKKRAEAEKEKIDAIRHRMARNKSLEKIRTAHAKENEKEPPLFERKGPSGAIQILDGGKLVGSVVVQGRNKTYLNAAGQKISHVAGGRTYDCFGRYIGKGDLGLLALGKFLSQSGRK